MLCVMSADTGLCLHCGQPRDALEVMPPCPTRAAAQHIQALVVRETERPMSVEHDWQKAWKESWQQLPLQRQGRLPVPDLPLVVADPHAGLDTCDPRTKETPATQERRRSDMRSDMSPFVFFILIPVTWPIVFVLFLLWLMARFPWGCTCFCCVVLAACVGGRMARETYDPPTPLPRAPAQPAQPPQPPKRALALAQAKALVAVYTRAIERNPRDAAAYYWRGRARADTGDMTGSLDDTVAAYSLDPGLAHNPPPTLHD